MTPRARRAGPILYAHRGAAAWLPENTLPSFRRALASGADALEMDVHLCRDGHVVVAHDPDGRRTAGVAGRIRECSLAEIRSWNVGRTFVDREGSRPGRHAQFVVPTMDEVHAELDGVPLNIDVKDWRPDIVPAVLRVIERRGAVDRVCLASFYSHILFHLRRRGYGGALALGREEVVALKFLPLALLRRLCVHSRAAQVPTRVGPIDFAQPSFVKKCRALDMTLDFWTINDPDAASKLLALGADGIMSDDPELIAPVVSRYRAARGVSA